MGGRRREGEKERDPLYAWILITTHEFIRGYL